MIGRLKVNVSADVKCLKWPTSCSATAAVGPFSDRVEVIVKLIVDVVEVIVHVVVTLRKISEVTSCEEKEHASVSKESS